MYSLLTLYVLETGSTSLAEVELAHLTGNSMMNRE
jgi:hypothetical protein